MNASIRESTQLYRSIFETASDGIVIIDLETSRVLAANPAAAEMHGYTNEVLCGMQFQQLIHTKSLPLFTNFALVIQQGNTFEVLAQHVRQDDTLFSVEWRAVAFKHHGKDCALVLLRDVSKRVEAEHQLQQRVGMRVHEQTTLLEISQTLASTLELQPGLILDQLGVLIKYTHAVLFTLEDSTLVASAVRGIRPSGEIRTIPYPLEWSGNIGDTVSTGIDPSVLRIYGVKMNHLQNF